jgi:hypothetical protein
MRNFIKQAIVRSLRFGLNMSKNIPRNGKFRAVDMVVKTARAESRTFLADVLSGLSVEDQFKILAFMDEHFNSRSDLHGFSSLWLTDGLTVGLLRKMWMSDEDMAEGHAIMEHFKQPPTGRPGAYATEGRREDDWPVDYSPAKNLEGAMELLRTRKYRWALIGGSVGGGDRRIGLFPVSKKTSGDVTPIREAAKEEVLVIRPMSNPIHGSVPVVTSSEDRPDLAAKYWDTLEATALTEEMLKSIQRDRSIRENKKVPVPSSVKEEVSPKIKRSKKSV